jgi:hypothetical protein
MNFENIMNWNFLLTFNPHQQKTKRQQESRN